MALPSCPLPNPHGLGLCPLTWQEALSMCDSIKHVRMRNDSGLFRWMHCHYKSPFKRGALRRWLRWSRICLQYRRPRYDSWVRKIPWRREWQPAPVFLPGKIPWTEEPGRLQSTGSQRVRHDWSTNTTIKNCGEHWCSLLISNLTQASYFSARHKPSTHTYTGTRKSNTIFLNYSKITGPSFVNSSTAHIVTPLALNLGFFFV